MKIREALDKVDALKPNSYTELEKIKWLSTRDGLIFNNIIETHESPVILEFKGYDSETSLDTVLIAEAPYDDMYVPWLEAKIDLANAEYGRYNNSISHFNDMYDEYQNWYNRTHMPLGTHHKYW